VEEETMSEQLNEAVGAENPTVETGVKKENTFTQEDVSNVVAKNVKDERAKLLKELGIEDVANGKKALAEYKKFQDSQKTELEQLQESSKTKDSEIQRLNSEISNFKNKQKLGKTLGDLSIDPTYTETVFKLMEMPEDVSDKDFKSLVESTIETYLPHLKEVKKVGAEKPNETKPKGSTKDYLDQKYKNNPFFKG